jgi:hypothetical protein
VTDAQTEFRRTPVPIEHPPPAIAFIGGANLVG